MINYKDNLEKILKGEIKVPYNSSLRKHILKNNIFKYECFKCNLDKWCGEEITLEIEHIDGDNYNNAKTNLCLLCPNCHSLTSTFRSKKLKVQNTNLSENIIIDEIKTGKNINQILLSLKLDNSGGNYKRIYNICKNNNIKIPEKKTPKPENNKQICQIKINSKIENLQNKINLIINSDIDFDKKGWSLKVSKILEIVPQAVKQWMIREMPEFYKNCWHHDDNKMAL